MEKGKWMRCWMICVFLAAGILMLTVSPDHTAIAAEKVWKIKVQAYTVPSEMDIQWAAPLKFTQLVEKHTKGLVKMSLHPSGEMVGPREIWTSVSSGTIDAGCTLDIYEGGTHPEFTFGVASLWTVDEFYKTMHAGALDILNRQSLSENIRMIGYFPMMNMYAMCMKTKHAKTLEDLKGKKIRGMGGAANVFLKEVGAGIVTMPMSEVPSALQTGVVEGVHTGMGGIFAMSLWDTSPYLTVTHHGSFNFFVILREDLYKTLPNDVKADILSAQQEFEGWIAGWINNFWKIVKEDVTKRGLIWYDLAPQEISRWRNLLNDVSVQWVMARNPGVGKELFTVVEKATGRKVMKK